MRAPRAPAFLFGVGLGGFIDGIVLHQVLQWHHMLTGEHGGEPSDTVAGLEANTLADGLFHLATWVVVAAAMTLTVSAWREGRLAPPWRVHVGLLLAGWGAFNLVEGLVDHQILGVHHVRDDLGGPLGWDLGFLGFAVLLIALGAALVNPPVARRTPRSGAGSRPPRRDPGRAPGPAIGRGRSRAGRR